MHRPVKLLLLFFLAASCSPKPEAIRYGKDACDFCRMVIMDPRFGGELVTQKGKVYKFDSEECLISFYKSQLPDTGRFSLILIADYDKPGELLNADRAVFLEDSTINTPMGGHLVAFPDEETAGKHNTSGGGKIMDWVGVLNRTP